MKQDRIRRAFYLLFFLSGFTGLIYESIWSHYLKLFLGHAAYAQALVLVIFMGGMALGAWITARLARRIPNLLLVYALAELLIGMLGLVFHPLFNWVVTESYATAIPSLTSVTLVHAYKWGVGALLILPQSFLLGTTFPLMSNGIIRQLPDTPGRSLSVLYFINSIGAAIGVLVSGFYLIGKVGLPGTVMFAGVINVLIAIAAYRLCKKDRYPPLADGETGSLTRAPALLLGAAFITGAASFIYEISWIRMLSMVLGSSTHAFELMLSAFITGLAFGGLWIRNRIDRLASPVRAAALVQIAMGVLALTTLPLYNVTFDIMAWFMAALNRSPDGYTLFNLASHSIALLVMLPTTFCAGITLPLFTSILLAEGYGERSIGRIYASNTLGAIAGVVFAIYIGMPLLGLKGAVLSGSLLDVGLGLVFLAVAGAGQQRRSAWMAPAAGSLLLLAATLLFVDLDVRHMASGVFRWGNPNLTDNARVIFHRDGRTATVSVAEWSNSTRNIATNGKPDAALNVDHPDDPSADENTMILAGTLPLFLHPGPRTAANIGMGSGLTTHVLLGWPGLERVDTIEIEPAMVEGARLFQRRVERTFTDPRSRIHIEDAKTFFSSHKQHYDVIVSEPSNPWVSGVASLFTTEFYQVISRHLNPGGVLVQWIHSYEINTELVFTIIRSLSEYFPDYHIYAANEGDLIIAAVLQDQVPVPRADVFSVEELRRSLANIGIMEVQDVQLRFLGGSRLFDPYIREAGIRANSDYFPTLDIEATRSRYLMMQAAEIFDPRFSHLPVLQLFYPEFERDTDTRVGPYLSPTHIVQAHYAEGIRAVAEGGKVRSDLHAQLINYRYLRNSYRTCEAEGEPDLWISALMQLMNQTLPYLAPHEIELLYREIHPVCMDAVTREQMLWLDLYLAFGRRDVRAAADTASTMLSQDFLHTPEQKQYLFQSLLTSLVVLEEYGQAMYLWNLYLRDAYPTDGEVTFTLRILHAMAAQGSGS